ncbi:MAG: hypothetical protein DMF04_02760 [Verrucomicrobia bacterium]|nr:MAG: hypothetical protein DMF04_02760 [Verrucomicrobiota bacterium]
MIPLPPPHATERNATRPTERDLENLPSSSGGRRLTLTFLPSLNGAQGCFTNARQMSVVSERKLAQALRPREARGFEKLQYAPSQSAVTAARPIE